MADLTYRVLNQHGDPVEGVTVHLYDETNTYRQATGVTDAAGEVTFTGLTAGTYVLRLCGKSIHAEISSPQTVNVKDPPISNVFEGTAETFEAPVSMNPEACRIYGWFTWPNMRPRQVAMHIFSTEDPVWVATGWESLGDLFSLASDENGYLEFDLVRGGLYAAHVAGYMDEPIVFRVPDQENVLLTDLLFPIPDTFVFDPAGPLALLVGDDPVTLEDSYLDLSSGFRVDAGTMEANVEDSVLRWVEYSSSDESVATAVPGVYGMPKITPVGAGVATITAELKDNTCRNYYPVTRPGASLTVTPVTVTVT